MSYVQLRGALDTLSNGTDLFDARRPIVIARLQHLRGLRLLDHHHPQPVPDHALHAVEVLDLWESAVGLIALCSRRRLTWRNSMKA